MWAKLRLVLAIFILASNCGGLPTKSPDGAPQSKDLPKDEYSDVIRLLNSSALADSEGSAKHGHAAKVGPHGVHGHPLVPADAVGAYKSAKKLAKTSSVKKYKTRKSKSKHSTKPVVKSEPVDSQLLNDSPSSDRVKEVLSRRKISSKRNAALKNPEAAVPEALTMAQPGFYNPYQFQPSFYSYPYPSPYPAFFNDYSYPSINPFAAPHYPSYPDYNNWDNNIGINNVPSEPIVTMPEIEPPEMSWEAEIEYPNMPPIIITSKNYTNNPHADVNIITGSDRPSSKPAAEPSKTSWTQPKINRGSRGTVEYPESPAPIIWSNGTPYVPLNFLLQPRYTPSFNPMATSFGTMASPFNFVSPPVYYRPPSDRPYTQNTPVQTWLPSTHPSFPTWPWTQPPNYNVYQSQGQNHEVNVFPASSYVGQENSIEEGGVRTSVFQGSKEVTGDKLEVNIIPANPNAPDFIDSDETPAGAA